MTVPRSFLNARRVWLQMRPPAPPSAQGSLGRAATLDADLYQLYLAIQTHVGDILGRSCSNSRALAQQTLKALSALSSLAADLKGIHRDHVLGYIDVTRALLKEVARLPDQESVAPVADGRLQLVETCNALLAGDITVVEAAVLINLLAFDLDPSYENRDLLVFVGINSEADVITTIDTERGWHQAAVDRKKAEREAFILAHQPAALVAADRLIQHYDVGNSA